MNIVAKALWLMLLGGFIMTVVEVGTGVKQPWWLDLCISFLYYWIVMHPALHGRKKA